MRRIAVILAYRQACCRFVRGHGWIGERLRRRRRILVDDEFLCRWASDLRSVAVLRHRKGHAEGRAALSRRNVPGAFDERISAVHQESVAGTARRRRVIRRRTVVKRAESERVAAIWQLQDNAVISLR